MTKPKTKPRTKRNNAGGKCTVCAHAKVERVGELIAKGLSFRDIAGQYGLTKSSVARHTENCLKIELQALVKDKKVSQAFSFEKTLAETIFEVRKMVDAASRWLEDPSDPERFYIGPRSDEIEVVYLDGDDLNAQFEPKRKKAQLQQLLEQVELRRVRQSDLEEYAKTISDQDERERFEEFVKQHAHQRIEAMAVATTAMDNRKLYLDSFKTFGDRLEQYAKFHGLYQKERENEANKLPKLARGVYLDLLGDGWEQEEALAFIKDRYKLDEAVLVSEVLN